MCKQCYEKAGSPAIINDQTERAAELIAKVYQTKGGGAGGYGHIVFDDWNVKDSSLDLCIKSAQAKEFDWVSAKCQKASLEALEAMKSMSVDERYSALAIWLGLI